MATRPIFIPAATGTSLVEEVPVQFPWHPGLSASQKKKNIVELHEAAAAQYGLAPLLEISSKSDIRAGQNLSAFHLKLKIGDREATVECVYQGSKVFENGGPFQDLYWVTSREAKSDERLRSSGRLTCFEFENVRYPTSPATVFYDWLYFRAIYPHREWLKKREEWVGFTDIEFNPERSVNCQARSFAAFISLQRRGRLDEAMSSFDAFRDLMQTASI